MDASGCAGASRVMVGATVVCGVVWAVVVVSAGAAGVGRSRDGDFGIARVVWVATGYYCRTGVGAARHSRRCRGGTCAYRRSLPAGVLCASACEVPVLVVAACSVFSQRAVMGALLPPGCNLYAYVVLLAMGFSFELPFRHGDAKAQMATPLAGGAAAALYFWRTCRSIVRFYFYDQGGLGHGISS